MTRKRLVDPHNHTVTQRAELLPLPELVVVIVENQGAYVKRRRKYGGRVLVTVSGCSAAFRAHLSVG